MTDQPTADTGFVVYREFDGSWTATTDFENIPLLTREAGAGDVKTGCREIYEAFAQNDLAEAIADKINANLPAEAQTTADAVRNALLERNQAL